MSQHIWLHFAYQNQARFKGSRSVDAVWVVDHAPFEIEEIETGDASLAYSVDTDEGTIDWYMVDGQLLRECRDSNDAPAALDQFAVLRNVRDLVGTGWTDHPMFAHTRHMTHTVANPGMTARREDFVEGERSPISSRAFVRWEQDNRENALFRASEVARQLRIRDGKLLRPAPEPMIAVYYDNGVKIRHWIAPEPRTLNPSALFRCDQAEAARECARILRADHRVPHNDAHEREHEDLPLEARIGYDIVPSGDGNRAWLDMIIGNLEFSIPSGFVPTLPLQAVHAYTTAVRALSKDRAGDSSLLESATATIKDLLTEPQDMPIMSLIAAFEEAAVQARANAFTPEDHPDLGLIANLP